MGAYYIATKAYLAKEYVKPERDNLDMIYISARTKYKPSAKRNPKNQSKFQSIEQFGKLRLPTKNIGVYFFGELHESKKENPKEDTFNHWNVGFLDLKNNMITFFDPARSIEDEQAYDFYSHQQIADAFNVRYSFFESTYRPQYVCRSGKENVDSFCQSWCLMFLDVYCTSIKNPNVLDMFLNKMRFDKHQTKIIKTWIICTVNKIYHTTSDKDWNLVHLYPALSAFPFIKHVKGKTISIEDLNCNLDPNNCLLSAITKFC
jgi:hypothetical protein